MREFAARVLSRSIASSAVVLLGRPQPQWQLAAYARSQGHRVLLDSHEAVKWVLLLFMDSGGDENEAARLRVMAGPLLKKATVTYIVSRFSPTPQPT